MSTQFLAIYGMWIVVLAAALCYSLIEFWCAPVRRTIHNLQQMERITDARIQEIIAERESYL